MSTKTEFGPRRSSVLTRFMLSVVGKPIIMPWPIYDRLGVNVHIHSVARYVPNNGIVNTAGKKYASSCIQNVRKD